MDPRSLKRRLLMRGCRFIVRVGPYALVANGDRRAIIPMHRGRLPRSLVEKILGDLEMRLR
jgi:hypothetical protein